MIIFMILLALSIGVSLLGLCFKKVDYKNFVIGSLVLCCLSIIFDMKVITEFIQQKSWVSLMDIEPIENPAIFALTLCLYANAFLVGVSKYRAKKLRDR